MKSTLTPDTIAKIQNDTRQLTGKPIYLISDIWRLPADMTIVTAEVVNGFSTAEVWTQTTQFLFDKNFAILEMRVIGKKSFSQSFYKGEGLGNPR